MARMRTSSALELLVPLDRDGPEPLHRQLEQGIREAVRSGRLAAGDAPCRRPGRWPRSSRSRAGSWSRPTSSSAPRAISRPRRAAPPASRSCRGRRAARADARRRPRVSDDRLPAGPARPRPFPRDAWLRSVGRALDDRARASGSAISTAAGRPSCALPWPTTSTASGARPPTPTRSSSAPGFAQGLKLVAQVLRDARRAPDRRRGPEPAETPRRPRARSASRSSRSRSTPRACAWTLLDGARVEAAVLDRRPPVPDRRRAAAGPPGGAHRLGRAPRRPRHRGRLRRRVPLRPRAGRGDAGARARTGSSTRDPRARSLAPGLRLGWIVAARRARRRGRRGQEGGRPRVAGHRPARVRRLPRPRRARPPPAPAAADLPARAATPCSPRSGGTCPSSGRSARRPGCISSPGCRPTWTRPRSSRRPGTERDPAPGCRPPPARGVRDRPRRSGWAG